MAMKKQQGVNSFLNDVFEADEYRVRVSTQEALPFAGQNPSLAITEVILGTVTTTTIAKLVGGVTYTKVVSEDTSTGITTVSAWV